MQEEQTKVNVWLRVSKGSSRTKVIGMGGYQVGWRERGGFHREGDGEGCGRIYHELSGVNRGWMHGRCNHV